MSTGDILSSIFLDSAIQGLSHGPALSINNIDTLFTTQFGVNGKTIDKFDINTGNFISQTIVGQHYESLYYDKATNTMWGTTAFKTVNTIDNFDLSGTIISSFAPIPAITPGDFIENPLSYMQGLSFSVDGKTLWMSVADGSRLYNFTKAGVYLGYIDSPIPGELQGITTDGVNLWLSLSPGLFTTTGSLIKMDELGNVLETIPLVKGFEQFITDIEYDYTTFAPKCAVWVRYYIVETYELGYAKAIEVPCPNQACTEPPVITATDSCLYVGCSFNPLTGVTATDCDGTNITNLVTVVNTVDTNTPGAYPVTYTVVSPTNGLSTSITVTVTVLAFTPRQQAITDLLQSVALEKAAISHILNAEAEKIKKAKDIGSSSQDLLAINNSVTATTNSIGQLEMVLQSKLALFKGCICLKCKK